MMPTLGITDLWTYVLGTLFIVLLPGPNSLFVLLSLIHILTLPTS